MGRELYRQSGFPVFQNKMYETREAARNCPRGNIEIIENQDTGMIYNAAFDPALVDYDSAYQNEQANSSVFEAHIDEVIGLVDQHMPGSIVEVGCGKGFFLDKLLENGVNALGFDPTYEGDNEFVKREYFSKDIGYRGDGLILRHVLEHVQDPYDFLTQLAEANDGTGLIYIEVPCFDWICTNRSWYDIFYEHVNYFRMRDFAAMFGRLVYAEHSFDGQYLSIIGDLSTLRPPKYSEERKVEFPSDFMAGLDRDLASTNGDLTVWGGASKGVIFSLLRERAGYAAPLVVDINPAKQSKYLPATGIEITSPSNVMETLPDGASVLIMNPNYIEEIKTMSNNRFNYMSLTND